MPQSVLFETNEINVSAAIAKSLANGKAKIEIKPSETHVHEIDGQPLREVFIDNELLGRFESYTPAAEYIIYVVNAVSSHDDE